MSFSSIRNCHVQMWKARFSHKILTGENDKSKYVSIRRLERIYEAVTFYLLIELVHGCRRFHSQPPNIVSATEAFRISYPRHSDISRYNDG